MTTTSSLGASIESDTWSYAGVDRVLPLIEKEQGTLAQAITWPMPGCRVLDVGCGCGLFAILAARAGCRATGIDCNPRAIGYSLTNAKMNGCDVELIEGRYNASSVARQSQDLIVLTPPYHPTPPCLEGHVAVHAEAGELGLDRFCEFLETALTHLAPGGRIVFHSMSPTRAGRPAALDRIAEISHGGLSGTLYRLAPTTSFATLLAQVYPEPAFQLEGWRSAIIRRWSAVDLLIGELSQCEPGTGRLSVLPFPELAPASWWTTQAAIHQQIAEEGLQRAAHPQGLIQRTA